MTNEIWKKVAVGIVCLAVGLFSVLPMVSVYFRLGTEFKGVWPERDGDRLYYFSRIHEVLDGHESINHPYFYEHKDIAYPQATLAERLQAGASRLFSLPVANLQVLIDFFSPALTALLIYLLFYNLGVGWIYALCAAVLLCTVVSSGLLKPIHPQLTFPLLLLFLLSWVRLHISPKKLLYALSSGILLGLLFLSYFYHWSFLFVVLGLYCIYLVYQKDYQLLRYHLLLIAVGVLLGLPYFLLVLSGLDALHGVETAVRVGVYKSHFPETIARLLVGLIWVGYFFWWGYVSGSTKKRAFVIIAVLLCANVIYPNHQIISGTIIQNANHWSFMPIFLFSLSAAYIISESLKFRRLGTPTFVYSVILATLILFAVPTLRLMSFGFSVDRYLASYTPSPVEISRQRYAELFAWIGGQEADSVILSNQDIMRYIPAYTHANVYYSDYAFNLPASDEEVIDRALLSQFFNPDFFNNPTFGMLTDTRILWTQAAQTERNTHKLHRLFNIPYVEKYSLDQEVAKVRIGFEELKKGGWNLQLLNKYRLDFIVWDTKVNPEWGLDTNRDLLELAAFGDFKIYRIAVYKP